MDMKERVAKAICETRNGPGSWAECRDRDAYLREASAAFNAVYDLDGSDRAEAQHRAAYEELISAAQENRLRSPG